MEEMPESVSERNRNVTCDFNILLSPGKRKVLQNVMDGFVPIVVADKRLKRYLVLYAATQHAEPASGTSYIDKLVDDFLGDNLRSGDHGPGMSYIKILHNFGRSPRSLKNFTGKVNPKGALNREEQILCMCLSGIVPVDAKNNFSYSPVRLFYIPEEYLDLEKYYEELYEGKDRAKSARKISHKNAGEPKKRSRN
jgi:hypothetical protein